LPHFEEQRFRLLAKAKMSLLIERLARQGGDCPGKSGISARGEE
jgi:hypothetical protein